MSTELEKNLMESTTGIIRSCVKACFVKDENGIVDEDKSTEKIVEYILMLCNELAEQEECEKEADQMCELTPEEKETFDYIVMRVILAHQLDDSYKITHEAEIAETESLNKAISLLKELSPDSFIHRGTL